jgi:hypothetical protein
LLHGKSVTIITTGNLEDVALEFFTKGVGFDLLAHSFFKEYSALIIIINVDGFGSSVNWIGDGELD